MNYKQEYERWLRSDALSPAEHAELESIAGDEKEIENRFYGPLEFGTAGLRGTMYVGLHNMNRHVIRWATQGFANVIRAEGEEAMKKGVAICMDCRNHSMEFARAAAEVCAGNGIHVRIFESLRPTPELSFAVRYYGCQAGINVTASHNPAIYNGIKVFNAQGYKLSDEMEGRVEDLILNHAKLPAAVDGAVGRRHHGMHALHSAYVQHLLGSIDCDLTGLRVLVDCANGAASATAPDLFRALPLQADFIHTEPDGVNINNGCGSTHLESLARGVVSGGYDLGIAFDGDADRCLGCDEKGHEMDGDKIIALLAMTMKEKDRLDGDTAVVTVMSNLGFIKYMESQGIHTEKTAVGDRYVLENMRENGFAIGGEQSGHVILLHHATTGDGELTAGKLLKLLAESGKKMSELNGIYEQYPQVLVNVTANAAQKAAYKEDEVLAGFIENEQQKLMGMGRVLVRVSGTEPKIRVMVEGQDLEAIHRCADRIVEKINKRILKQ